MNRKLLVIGCGGVAAVAIQKCCQNSEMFPELVLASRTVEKCDALVASLKGKTETVLSTAKVDADKVEEVVALIRRVQPYAVLNVALPYQDLTIMEACLHCGVHYIDTANFEPENTEDPAWRKVYDKRVEEEGFSALFDYSWQWAYAEKFEKAGLTALLGTGFDPGVTSVFVSYAKKHYFDHIDTVDILDCNGGDHGYAFATNFNPEINLREVSAPGSYWEDGKWVEIPAMSIKRGYDFPEVGKKDMYLLHHEEIEALGKHFPEIKRIRFFMTFGQSYLTHMKCLENVGMLSTTPIDFQGTKIVPIQFLKALLPDPASLGPRTKGKTNIGCVISGVKDDKPKTIFIYNVCDHEECYRELGSQAISYTTGVPAMIGTALVLDGAWRKPGVFTTDEFDPDPYMDMLNKWGLPWVVVEDPETVE
ncbi:MAG TPA: saccharopine dehydrogenase family protein [Clostridia bacterium]|nr:saccharopine dehydrogenase family protein [Clostridia bacterium]